MMIVDWGTHMFSRDRRRFPYHSQAAYTPEESALQDDPLATYLDYMRREGIDRAVLVQPEPYGDDHSLLLECLAREPERLRGASLFYPNDPDAPRKLAELVRHPEGTRPRIVAVRFHAHRGKETYLNSFADDGVRALWRAAAELGLVVELHIGPNYAADVASAIAAYPGVPVLIDHLAEPHMGNAVEYAEVLGLARFENVYMKISGLSHISDDAPLYLDVKRFTRLVADTCGPQRLVWGNDTFQAVDAQLDHFSADERARVKGGNLAALLGFSS
jgi:predicted TIM-barrel fold metal-dependent hydrolase